MSAVHFMDSAFLIYWESSSCQVKKWYGKRALRQKHFCRCSDEKRRGNAANEMLSLADEIRSPESVYVHRSCAAADYHAADRPVNGEKARPKRIINKSKTESLFCTFDAICGKIKLREGKISRKPVYGNRFIDIHLHTHTMRLVTPSRLLYGSFCITFRISAYRRSAAGYTGAGEGI